MRRRVTHLEILGGACFIATALMTPVLWSKPDGPSALVLLAVLGNAAWTLVVLREVTRG